MYNLGMDIIKSNSYNDMKKITRINKLKDEFNFSFIKETKRGKIREYHLKCSHGHSYIKNAKSQYFYCPKCSLKGSSYSEEVIRGYFESYSGKKFNKKILKSNNQKFELDGYNEELKIAFEHDGCQHYDFNAFKKITKKGKKEFNELRKRDKFKDNYCKIKGINLIRFKQLHKYSKIEDVENICKKIFKKKKIKQLSINLKSKYYNEVKEKLKKYNCSLVNDNEYLGSQDVVIYKCRKGHKHKTTAAKIKHKFKGCSTCHEELRKKEQLRKIKKVEKKLNITFIPSEIINRESYVSFTCNKCSKEISKPLKRFFDNYTEDKKACKCTNRAPKNKEAIFIKSFDNYLSIKKKKKRTKKDEIYLFKFKNKNKSIIGELQKFLSKDIYEKIHKELIN